MEIKRETSFTKNVKCQDVYTESQADYVLPDYLGDVRKIYFTREEFETAKRVVYANNLFNFDSTDDSANTFMTFWQNGGDYLSYSACLSKIGYEEAREVLKNTVRTDRCAMSVVYPKEGKDE